MRTFLITGATSGIGEACARRCFAHGDRVVALCRNLEKAQQLFGPELSSGQLVVFEHDLAHNEGLYEQCLKELAPYQIDRFIHCAGLIYLKPIHRTTHQEWLSMYELHLFALSEIMRALVRLSRLHHELSVVALSSVSAHGGLLQSAAYGMSKESVEHYIRLLNKQLNKQLNAVPQKRLAPPTEALAAAEAMTDPAQREHALVLAKTQAGLRLRINALAPAMINTPMAGGSEDILDEMYYIPLEVIIHWIFEILENPYMSGQTVVLNNDFVY